MGINGGQRALADLTMGQVEAVVRVNFVGVVFCTKVALDVMGAQAGVTGNIFNTMGVGVTKGRTLGHAT